VEFPTIFSLRYHLLSKLVHFNVIQRSQNPSGTNSGTKSVSTDASLSHVAAVEIHREDVQKDRFESEDYESEGSGKRKRSKKRKIYCFNCNRQEFHIMAYKGTLLHSFLVGMSFGTAHIFGPFRCTCCGKTRAMFADFCSLSYHWRMMSQRRLSKTGRRRSRSRSRSKRR